MQQNIFNIVKKFKMAVVVLFVALVGVQMSGVSAFARTQTAAPTQVATLESSTQAKRAMETLKTINYSRIKDARQREAVRRAVNAVKALAANTSPAREAGLIAKLKLAANGLKPRNNDHPTGAGQKCIDEAIDCDKNGFIMCDLGLTMCLTAEYNEMNKPGKLPE